MRKKTIILTLIIIFAIILSIFGYNSYNTFKNPTSAFSSTKMPNSSKITDKAKKNNSEFSSEKIYLAFLGLDMTDERIKTIGNFRTDTIGIFSIDLKTKKVNLLSIPRDTYVQIPGRKGYDKINAAYPYGGMGKSGYELSLKTISNFLGIDVNYYISIDMQNISQIVDAVGGVPINVEEDMHTHGANLNKGYQVLDGKKAEEYVRWRYDPMGDINRVKRQQQFLLAFLKQLKANKNDVSSYIKLYDAFKGDIYTNLNFNQILALISVMKDVNADDIKTYTVPGSFYNLNNISYWKPDMEKLNEILKEFK
ncbi:MULTISPECIES: LCP family protein [Thermoanaerobacterium]|uniref:Cell envelope-related transcriptional attenuator n=1 Tax=Thermoanaerobacterium xylanolyticum (strain ATCC 49914 / DSM 7097 / LX-11) TaxID=858215 RepID=F6BI56_THEXL|nr:LCP family protein [Thermoanaerobacterium xylanolyticum]AEF17730.1 cell envelope-related transcriptional attenuator [Thermoanaerobacterium xylanolyticum LX-11]